MSGTTEHRERTTFDSASYLATLMAELDRAEISNRIRSARKQAGFRNRQMLADVMQVHWRTIEDWENPKHANVPWDRMEELSGVLNVSKMWLLHGEPEGSEASVGSLADRLESLEVLTTTGFEALEAAIAQLADQLRPREHAEGNG